MRAARLASLSLLLATVAGADWRYGPPPPDTLGRQVRSRVAPDAGAAHTFHVGTWTSYAPLDVSAALFYAGEIAMAGDVELVVTREDGGVRSSTARVGDAGWVEWTFAPPLNLTGTTVFAQRTTDADVTFLHLDHAVETNHQVGGDVYPLGYFWSTTSYRSETSAVLRLAGGADPFAPATCPPADRDQVIGFPWVHAGEVPFDGGTMTQTFLWPGPEPRTTPIAVYSGEAYLSGLVSGGAWETTLVGADGGVYRSPRTWGLSTTWGVTPPTPDGGPSAPFGVSVQQHDGGAAAWLLIDTGATPSDCHPAARATFGGSLARAAGFPAGADFLVRLGPGDTYPIFRDGDGDGFGDDAGQDWARGTPPGFSWTADDCDDRNAAISPAASEVCDGLDDDCDGRTDVDDTDLRVAACERQHGACAGALHQPWQCVTGAWSACGQADYFPQYEAEELTCDGLDNDCDAQIDEAPGAPCALQLGVCAGSRAAACSAAAPACEPAAYGPDYQARETRCDGLDNDCDGLADGDDEVQPTACELQQGVCAGAFHATSQCASAGWTPCGGGEYGARYEPAERQCDGFDNDCDGATDEGCPEVVPPPPLNPLPSGCGCTSIDGAAVVGGALAVLGLLRRRRRAVLVLVLSAGALGATLTTQRELTAEPDSSHFETPKLLFDGETYVLSYRDGTRSNARFGPTSWLALTPDGRVGPAREWPFGSPPVCAFGQCVTARNPGLERVEWTDGGWRATMLVAAGVENVGAADDDWVAVSGSTFQRVPVDGGAPGAALPLGSADWYSLMAANGQTVVFLGSSPYTTAWSLYPDGGTRRTDLTPNYAASPLGLTWDGTSFVAGVADNRGVGVAALDGVGALAVQWAVVSLASARFAQAASSRGTVVAWASALNWPGPLRTWRPMVPGAVVHDTIVAGAGSWGEVLLAMGADGGLACMLDRSGRGSACAPIEDDGALAGRQWTLYDRFTRLDDVGIWPNADGGALVTAWETARDELAFARVASGAAPAVGTRRFLLRPHVIGRELDGTVLAAGHQRGMPYGTLTRLGLDLAPREEARLDPRDTQAAAAAGRAYTARAWENELAVTEFLFPRIVRTVTLRRDAPSLQTLTANDRGALVTWSEDGGLWAAADQFGAPLTAPVRLGAFVSAPLVGPEGERWRLLLPADGGWSQLVLSIADAGLATQAAQPWPGTGCVPSAVSGGRRCLAACADGTSVRMAWLDDPTSLREVRLDAGVSAVAAATLPTGAVVAVSSREPWDGGGLHTIWLDERALGARCGADVECESLHCVDGVCCDSACGEGAGDCEACSRERGAAADGTCTLLPRDVVCGGPTACLDDARCDGVGAACAAAPLPNGTRCDLDGGAGACREGLCESVGRPGGPRLPVDETSVSLRAPRSCAATGSAPLVLAALVALRCLRRHHPGRRPSADA